MTAYYLNVVSWDGNALQTADYTAMLAPDADVKGTVPGQAVDVDRLFSSPLTVGVTKQGKAYPVIVTLATTDEAKLDTLQSWFRADGTKKYLRLTNGAGTALRVACVSLGMSRLDRLRFVGRLWADDGTLEQDAEQTSSTGPQTTSPVAVASPTVAGSEICYPTITITPNAAKSNANGWVYRTFVVIANKTPRTVTDSLGLGFPVDIWNHLFDMATLTTDHMKANGDDVRVFIDGKKITNFVGENRYFGPTHIDTTTAKLWVSISFRPGHTATLDGAMTLTVPGDTSSIHVDNAGGLSGWPSSGYLLADDEVIWYGSRDNDYFYDIRRSQMADADDAAVHADGITLYWVEHQIEVLYDYTGAGAGPAPDDFKPVIDLENSTNALHLYTGPFIDTDSLRTGQFLPTFRETNEIAPYLSMDDSGTLIKIIDTPPTAGKPQHNNLELYTPLGVDTAADSLWQTLAIPANMLLRAYGTDVDGNESLLAEWDVGDSGTTAKITPASVLTRLRYEGLVRTVTAAEGTAGGTVAIGGADDQQAQTFTLEQATTIYGVSVKLMKTEDADGNILVSILQVDGTTHPDDCPRIVFEATLCAVADISAAVFGEHAVLFSPTVTVPAGQYYLLLKRTGSTHAVYWGTMVTTYAKGEAWGEVATTWTEDPSYDRWFRIYGDGSVCQDEVPTGTAAIVSLDSIRHAVNAPLYFKTKAAATIYAFSGVLANATTGQSVTIFAIGKLNAPLVIDCAKREIRGGLLAQPMPYSADWSDETVGLYFVPGANVVTWAEPSIGTASFVTTWRGRFS